MGGSSWQCTVQGGTDNPPLGVIRDKDGAALLQTQDGGKTYGYLLTGLRNTDEYVLVAEDGRQGLDGCIIRRGEWALGIEWRNDQGLATWPRYLDVALVRDAATATGWRAYRCRVTHTSSAANAPGQSSAYWEEFGVNTTAIFTSLIIAKDARIDFMSGNQLLIQKDDGTVTAGLSGSQSGDKVRIWAGSATPEEAPFRVIESGKMVATDAEVHGSGSFEGDLTAQTLNLALCTNGNEEIYNGAIKLDWVTEGLLPKLKQNECREIKICWPLMTKTIIPFTLKCEDDTVFIAIEGLWIGYSYHSLYIENVQGLSFNLIGVNNNGNTYWNLFALNGAAQKYIDGLTGV